MMMGEDVGSSFFLPSSQQPTTRYHQMTVRNFSTAGMEGKGGRKEMTTYTRPSPPFTLGATVRLELEGVKNEGLMLG